MVYLSLALTDVTIQNKLLLACKESICCIFLSFHRNCFLPALWPFICHFQLVKPICRSSLTPTIQPSNPFCTCCRLGNHLDADRVFNKLRIWIFIHNAIHNLMPHKSQAF